MSRPINKTLLSQIPGDPGDKELPGDILLALGNEGVEKSDLGDPIRTEIALRWTKIMAEGLSKESRDNLIKK